MSPFTSPMATVLSRNTTRLAAAAALACAALLAAGGAAAQSYPSKTVVARVAYPAGGPADVAVRKLQPALQAALGQPLVIENLPGAGGSIAVRNVLSASADGHTLLVTTGNDAILAPLTLAAAKYRADSLRLVATLFPTDFALVTNATHSFKSVDDFVESARKPGGKELSFGSWGYGSAPFLVGEDFKAMTGIRMIDVPYKGAAPVIQGLLTNEIDAAFVPLAASVLGMVNEGKIKVIGIANLKRNPYLPLAPTLNEGKYAKNFSYSAWAGLFVPASTPEPVVARLSRDVGEIVKGAEYQKFLQESAALPVEAMSLAQAAAFYKAENEKFTRVARSVKIEPQ